MPDLDRQEECLPALPVAEDCAPARSLHGRVGSLEASIRIIAAGHEQITQQLSEMSVRLVDQDRRIDRHATMLTTMAGEVRALSASSREAITLMKQVRDVVITGRMVGRFSRWLVPSLVALGVLATMALGTVSDVGKFVHQVYRSMKEKDQ